MPINSKWDSSCKVCSKEWKSGATLHGIKTDEINDQGRPKLRWCSDPNCSAPTGTAQAAANSQGQQSTAPGPQVSTSALQLGFNDAQIMALTDKVMHINKIVSEQMKTHQQLANPALAGMITKYILDVEARK